MNLKATAPPTYHPNSSWEDNSTRFRKYERPTKRTDSKDRHDRYIINLSSYLSCWQTAIHWCTEFINTRSSLVLVESAT